MTYAPALVGCGVGAGLTVGTAVGSGAAGPVKVGVERRVGTRLDPRLAVEPGEGVTF